VIWVRREPIYFCKWDWTTQITLIRFNKIAPWRRRRPGYGFKKIAKAASLASNVRATMRRGNTMKLEGGCYCGGVRYVAEGEPMMKAQCHCRECQYISGGAPNMFVLMPIDGFKFTKGSPKKFARSDLERPVTREFCAECGTHMVTRPQVVPAIVLKVGTLDDPALFEGPQLAIYTVDKQPFHQIPEGLPAFERLPKRG
jgi:hypothetical protein